jgi:hypothetical protein
MHSLSRLQDPMRTRTSRSLWHALVACVLLSMGACDDALETVEAEPIGADDGSGAPAPLLTLTATVGPEGGELIGEAGTQLAGVRLVVPAGALAEPTQLALQGTIDPTPLPPTAEGIGPQFAILPDGVEFAVPAELTVPFDPMLRAGWETPNEDCRVWYRDGEGWARADAIAATDQGVTVEIPRATVAGAGTFASIEPVACRFNCATATPGPTCFDGDRFCLTRLGTQATPSSSSTYSLARGVLYWPFAPSSGAVAIAGFDVLNRRAVASTGAANALSGSPAGDIVPDDTGGLWLGFRHRANVRFEVGRLATLFDAFSTSTDPLALGVAYDQASRLPVRFRSTVIPPRSGQPLSQSVTVVRGGSVFSLGVAYGAFELDGVIALGRALSPPPGQPFLVFGGRWGVQTRSMTTTTEMRFPITCGGQPIAEIRAVSGAPTRGGFAMLCRRTDNRGAVIVNGAVRQSFEVGQIPTGRMTMDGDGNVYLADLTRPQITRFGTDGGAVVVPLTTLTDTSDPAYAAMIPIAVQYDNGLDSLVLVARGLNGVREFWQISNVR